MLTEQKEPPTYRTAPLVVLSVNALLIMLLNTKRRLLYLKTQSVPRCKHFSSRLQKPISLCYMGKKSLFVLT